MSKTVKDLTAGTAGGILQGSAFYIYKRVLVGQPFDIVKVRMQTSPPGTYNGMVHCATGILRNEGPLAFYKGTLTPLLGIGVCVSIQFAVLESAKRYFSAQNIRDNRGGPDGRMFTGPQLILSGALAGVANGFVSGPVEHIRIRLQTQPSINPPYAGPWAAVRIISGAHGIQGIFKGQTATFAREAVGYGAYFWAYESLMKWEMRRHGIRREDIPAPKTVVFGAAAGYALWACIYPIDVIKSRMQTDGFSPETGRKYNSTLDCIRKVWKTEGPAAFMRGLGPTLIRSPFANGATFLGFELASRWLYAGSDH